MVIDTNVFIEYLRARDKAQTTLFKLPESSIIFISSITLFELYIGAINAGKWSDITKLTEDIPVLAVNEKVSIQAAKIYQLLKQANQMIDFRDILIAATALANDLPLLTKNKKDFKRVEDIILV